MLSLCVVNEVMPRPAQHIQELGGLLQFRNGEAVYMELPLS